MVLYPASHDLQTLSSAELALKIARHSPCVLCSCNGLHPLENEIVNLRELDGDEHEDDVLIDTCACEHGVAEHGNAEDVPESEVFRRSKVAIRMDELLDDVGKLLDFKYVDDDLASLRRQMNVIDTDGYITETRSASSPLSMLDQNSPLSLHSPPVAAPSLPNSDSSLSDEEEDQPLARRIPAQTTSGKGGKKTGMDTTRKATGDLSAVDTNVTSSPRVTKDERPSPIHLERLVTGVTVDAAASSSLRPDKPCVAELRKGIIKVISVNMDGKPQSLVILTGLKTLFQKQLPKMPREYISRLVYDHNSRALAIVKSGWKVVGGILFRPFAHRGFAEIVFFATASIDQIKGYGGMLMNHFKMHIKATYPGMMHFLTYADNYAVGYFRKQGFTKDITLDRSVWAGYIKDYEGATILQCSVLPKMDYTQTREILTLQRKAILERIREKSKSHVVYSAPRAFVEAPKGVPVKLDPKDVPGLRETGWNPSMTQLPMSTHGNPDQAIMLQLLQALQTHAQSWAFLQPVNGEEVTDYYDVIKKPMDFNTMEHKLTHNRYDTLADFADDANLVFQNCLLYNPEGTVYAKNAIKMQKFLDEQLAVVAPHLMKNEY